MRQVGPLHDMNDLPEEGALLLLHFADGSARDGVRIGNAFLSRGQPVQPLKWQLLYRVGMVAKTDGRSNVSG